LTQSNGKGESRDTTTAIIIGARSSCHSITMSSDDEGHGGGGDPSGYNGGAVVAMVGKGCVAIASDLRYGIQGQTLASTMPKVFQITSRVWVGLGGLATDMQTLYQKLKFRANLYQLREEREIEPEAFGWMVSSMLYEKRFGPYFVEPVVAGLDKNGQPYICSMDLIGAQQFVKDFVLSGTCTENLYGMCESLYRPNLEPDDLFEVVAQALMSAVDRDAVSGWGGIVHVITKDQVVSRVLKARQD